MQEGIVKFFDGSKGFGFITSSKGDDIFVHVTGLIDEIKDGDRVRYEVQKGKKGLNAVKVQLI